MSIGPWQLIIILVMILLIFKPQRLKEVGKSLGDFVHALKSTAQGKEDIDVTDLSRNEQYEANPRNPKT